MRIYAKYIIYIWLFVLLCSTVAFADWPQWCLDEYRESFYALSPKNNPLAGETLSALLADYKNVKTKRVYRGGAWDTYDNLIRCANRFKGEPTDGGGFRCVSSPVR